MLAAARKPGPAESHGIGIRGLTPWAAAGESRGCPAVSLSDAARLPPAMAGVAARVGKRRKKKLIHFSDDADRSFSTVPAGT